ncbi:MAG: hypothetical protein QM726_12985 [Chitinophagaceae bacterium]
MQIEKYELQNDLQLFGVRVPDFPNGVKQGFDTLVANLPEGLARSYYGVSWMEKDAVVYFAMAAEQFAGESLQHSFKEKILIPKGTYQSIAIKDWMKQLDCIKDAFYELMQHPSTAVNTVCVEWYKDDSEMLCLMKAATTV